MNYIYFDFDFLKLTCYNRTSLVFQRDATMYDLLRPIIAFFMHHVVIANRRVCSSVDNSDTEVNVEQIPLTLSDHTMHCDFKLDLALDIRYIKSLSRRLGKDIVKYALQKTKGHPPKSTYYHVRTLRIIVDYIMEKHQLQFMDMTAKLEIDNVETVCNSFVTIADKMFLDKELNWGRVVTLYAFAAFLIDYCSRNHDQQDLVNKLGEALGSYVSDNLTDWIYGQGGWVSSLYTTLV